MNVKMLVLNNFTHDARVHKEASSLAATGHDVCVLALHEKGLPKVEGVNGFLVRRLVLRSRRWRGGRLAPVLKYMELIMRVLHATRTPQTDVYHSHNANTLLATYPAVRRDSALWVYDSHELETGRNFASSHLAGIYRRLWALPERLFIDHVDAVISANASYASELVRKYAVEAPTVVRNCPEYVPPLESDSLRLALQIPSDHIIVLYQGLVTKNRGIEVCIRSLQHLDKYVHFVVLGDGQEMKAMKALAADLNVEDRVHLPGRVALADLPDYTASADVGLTLIQNSCDSYYLTLPNKILEYMMAGLPVVASDFPEMRKVVVDHDVGEVVADPSSPRDVAAAIDRVLSDRDRYERMRRKAYRAARVLNWENEQERLLRLYEELAQRHPGLRS